MNHCITILIALLLFSGCTGRQKKEPAFQSAGYELIHDWPKLPENFVLGSPTGIGIDSAQNIVVFHRAGRNWPLLLPMPGTPVKANTILVIDRHTGKLLTSWGAGLFIMPHGLTVDQQNNIWVTDVGLHQVFKFDHDGHLLMKLGEAGVAGNDATHFNKPTDIAVAADGSFYVSDGYGNSRIVHYTASGQYLQEWGHKGSSPGELAIPHSLAMAKDGRIYVADRENRRVQVFTGNGRLVNTFTAKNAGHLCAITYDPVAGHWIAADDTNRFGLFHLGSDILVFDSSGTLLARFGRSSGYQGTACWYHDIAVDNEGNIYAGDINGNRLHKFSPVKAKE